jgi:hypothetical protein
MREPRRSTEAAGLVWSTKEPRENTEEPRRSTEARPKVSCGAPSRRRGAGEEHQSKAKEPRTAEAEEGTEAAGFVRSTEEPRGSTGARPNRSTDARPRHPPRTPLPPRPGPP